MYPPGSSLGKYDLIEPLGSGGMGTVYKARDRVLDRIVAIKLINTTAGDVDARVGRFAAEAKIVAHLQHPNIIPIYDFGSSDGVVYFVSPLIEGETLAQIIGEGPLGLGDLAAVLRQIASALDYAHANGVIHRDIKPHNIMIDREGTAHLMDFGIAKAPQEADLTVTGQLVGTPIYMAPELFTGQPFDYRIDLYALGLVAFEMFTGKKAFATGTSMHATMLQIMEGASLRLEVLRPDLPKHIVDAVHRALAVKPDARFAKAQDFIDALFPHSQAATEKRESTLGMVQRVMEWLGMRGGRGASQDVHPPAATPSPKPDRPAPVTADGGATQLFRPLSARTPSRPSEPAGPSEYTQVVSPRPQTPAKSPSPPVFVPPAAPSFPPPALRQPPSAPPRESDEFTQMFQPLPSPPSMSRPPVAGVAPLSPAKSTPPAARPSSPGEPDDFTRLFNPSPSPFPAKPAPPPPAAPSSSPAGPGEFTRLFPAPPNVSPPKAKPPAAPAPVEPGEFTQFFQAPTGPPPAKPAAPAPTTPPATGPDEFTQYFDELTSPQHSSATPGIPAAPPASTASPLEPGEFTRAFQSPAAPQVEPSAATDASPVKKTAEHESSPPEPARAEGVAPTPLSSPTPRPEPDQAANPEATRMFSTSPLPQDSPIDEQIASIVPGEATRLFASPSAHSDSSKIAPTDVALFIASCVDPGFVGRRVRIRTTPFKIGRNSADVQFPLSFDQAVSAVHAQIDHTAEGWVIRDLDSANGTFLGGKRIVPGKDELLFFGVKILLGTNTQLVFVIHEPQEIPDLTGKAIANGRYVLRQRLHSSVKSAVYVALDRHLENEVAIKILSPRLAGYPGYCDQFKREAATASRLLHSNICPVIDHGEAFVSTGPGSTSLYVTMKHLEGGSLSHLLPLAELDLNAAAGWLERICEALDYLGREGVVHGGIKPSAIVFDSRQVPYLTDFAFAAKPGQGEQRAVIGSPGYLAPEQWEGQPLTSATDQYSLAVLFYYLLTGSLPYQDQDNPAAREANFKRGPVAAHEKAQQAGRNLPPVLSPVLHRALLRKPEDRFPTAREFAEAFRAALRAPEVPIQPVKPELKPAMLFLSYHRPSSQYLAILLQRELQAEGYHVFVDSQQRDTVGRFPKKIERAIERCTVFLCLLAPATLKSSEWVNREIEFALEKGKQILPVFHDGFVEPQDDADVPQHIRQLLEYDAVRIVDTQSHYITAWLAWLKESIRQLTAPPS